MTFLLLALLVAIAIATAMVLADSGLRLWSAAGGMAAQRAHLRKGVDVTGLRARPAARVRTQVSYARSASVPQRAAA